jgi:branched-chain amino acid transport system permease protein
MIGIPVIDIDLGLFSVSAGNPIGFFLIVLVVIMGLYSLSGYLLETPFGRVLTAIKANERRVPFLGYSVWTARLAAYVLAAVIAGLSGALYPMLRGFVSPDMMFFSTSGNAVIAVILGGVGTLIGPLYGGVLLVVLRSVVGSWTEHHLIIIGVLFMAGVIFAPKGLIGVIRPAVVRAFERRSSKAGVPGPEVCAPAMCELENAVGRDKP